MLFVGAGGVIGAIGRYLLGKWIMSRSKTTFPLGTWLINISGSFALGLFVSFYSNGKIYEWLWLLIGIGFLGSYTTMSTFGYEVVQLLQKRQKCTAIVYVVTSVVLGVLFVFLGMMLGGCFG